MAMAYSQNGWTVLFNSDNLDNRPLPNTTVKLAPGVRKGPAGKLLRYVATQFHKRVEKLDNPTLDDWGWNCRPIRGQVTGYSNHAAATAIDLNAPRHGRQSTNRYLGFNDAQVAEIHQILKECGGVVRWGGDYASAPYDPMHFEINAGYDAVHAAAEKLPKNVWDRIKSKVRPKIKLAYVRPGKHNNAVKKLQRALNKHGFNLKVDGDFGPATRKAWKAWEHQIGLPNPNEFPQWRSLNALGFKVI